LGITDREPVTMPSDELKTIQFKNSWTGGEKLFIRVIMRDKLIIGRNNDGYVYQLCDLVWQDNLKYLPEQPEGTKLYSKCDEAMEPGSVHPVFTHNLEWINDQDINRLNK